MTIPAEVSRYLPTLEAVRDNPLLDVHLPPGQPSHVYGAAAIVMQVDGLRREAWTDDVELSERLFEDYPKGYPPAPSRDRAASYKVIDDSSPAVRQRCMTCILRPGFSPCVQCGGTGMVGEFTPCVGCSGGFGKCSTCDGTQVAVRARVRYVNDTPVNLRQLFVPPLPRELHARIEHALSPSASWPEALRFEAEPAMVGTAYRGASAVKQPDFHGFFFGDALTAATRSLAASTRDVVGVETRTYGVAILWLVYEGAGPTAHAAAFVRHDGELLVVSARVG